MKPTSCHPWATRASCLVALSWALGAAPTPAHALDVAGVHYQDAKQIGNHALLLNGAGVRELASTDLYTAGLYLQKITNTPQAVLNDTGAKQLRLVILRDISTKRLADMLTQGLLANVSDEELAKLVSEIFNISMMLYDQGKLLPGDSIQIDSHPVTGTTVTIAGKGRGMPVSQTFAKPGMFKVLMGIWLGTRPADARLKNALLGLPL